LLLFHASTNAKIPADTLKEFIKYAENALTGSYRLFKNHHMNLNNGDKNKLQSVTFGALTVNKQNCMRLAEESCGSSFFSLFMSMSSHTGTGLLRPKPV